MLYLWKPDRASDVPLYLQLVNYFSALIEGGEIPAGYRLPGRRKLMDMFDVSRSTVTTAFEKLISQGLVLSTPKSGVVAADLSKAHSVDWDGYFRRARSRFGTDEYRFWAQMGGMTDFALSDEFDSTKYCRSAFLGAADRIGTNVEYHKYGFPPLRRSLQEYLKTAGIEAQEDNIFILPSVTSATSVIFHALMGSNSVCLHEKVNPLITVSGIHADGINLVGIPMDRYGMSATMLEKHAMKVNKGLIHVDPTDHTPTGRVMSRKRKADILSISQKSHIPLMEVDHLRDLWVGEPYPLPMKSMPNSENVLYVGAFIMGKRFDMRIGWLVAEKAVIEQISNSVAQLDIRASIMLQIIADEMLRSGCYYRMLEEARSFVAMRREEALTLCRKYFSGQAEWSEKHTNFHLWLNFPNTNIRALFNDSVYRSFYPGYFFDRGDTSHVLLNPPTLSRAELEDTIKYLAHATSQML